MDAVLILVREVHRAFLYQEVHSVFVAVEEGRIELRELVEQAFFEVLLGVARRADQEPALGEAEDSDQQGEGEDAQHRFAHEIDV